MGSKIVDATSDLVLATSAEEADTHWSRFRGLMGRRRLVDGSGLIIRPCKSIHMMFMRFPIDVVFFDKEGRVTSVSQRVRPWIGMAWGGKGASAVIELPVGAAADVEVGDRLEFES
jgi:hypothetical protein